MIDRIYQVGVGPCPVVLGLRLQPLTVGHALLLHRLNSPFVSGGPVDLPALMEAVLVCSLPVEGALDALGSRWRNLVTKRWLRKIRKLDINRDRDVFNEWLSGQFGRVECWAKSDGRAPVMPGVERLLASLCGDLGQSVDRALDLPLLAASRLMLAHAEAHGLVEPVSEVEQDLIEYAKAHPIDLSRIPNLNAN
jgi:hypothetical protein